MFRRLDRYIIREIAAPSGLALLVSTFILMTPPITKNAQELLAQGVSFSLVVRLLAPASAPDAGGHDPDGVPCRDPRGLRTPLRRLRMGRDAVLWRQPLSDAQARAPHGRPRVGHHPMGDDRGRPLVQPGGPRHPVQRAGDHRRGAGQAEGLLPGVSGIGDLRQKRESGRARLARRIHRGDRSTGHPSSTSRDTAACWWTEASTRCRSSSRTARSTP